MAIPEECAARLDEIRSDRTSGAAHLTLRAATLLVEYAESAPEAIPEIAQAIVEAQPAMAPIYNLTRRVLATTDVKAACVAFLESMEESVDRVAQNAASLIADGATVMTCSFSSTVLGAFREARKEGRRFTVICPESRPVCEGLALAANLGMDGIDASVITDAAVYRLLPEAQLVFVGADAISLRGVSNKTGTALIGLAARELGVPFYVLCSSDKFLPASYRPPAETTKNPSEILERELPHVTALNYYFDLTPLAFVSGVVTESGILTLDGLRPLLQ
jgi:translation initiation factor 2B subunit (eIF-2B alpha/beta/delta family)